MEAILRSGGRRWQADGERSFFHSSIGNKASAIVRGLLASPRSRLRWSSKEFLLRQAQSDLLTILFFGQCCAGRNNCGSHEYMLNWSSVDNSIAQIGQ